MYKCPHCGREIKEVSSIELSARRILFSISLGIGVGLLVVSYISPQAAAGGAILGALIAFLLIGRP
jgi:hypothetical protein